MKAGLVLTAAAVLSIGAPESEVPVVKVGHVGHDHQIALFIAALEGPVFQKEYGICLKEKKAREVYDLVDGGKTLAELHIVKVGGGSEMPAAMERGEIQVGFGGVASIASFRDRGDPFKIIFPLQTDGDMLVVRPGIPADGWDSFVDFVKRSGKPVKIGYKAPVAVAKIILMRALREAGIPCAAGRDGAGPKGGTVQMVNLQGENNMVPSLASGAVDGFVMNQPQVSLAKVKGVGKIVCDLASLPPKGIWKDHPCCCVAATETMIQDHRGVLVALVKLMILSTERINADKKRAATLTARWTKLPLEAEQDSVPSIAYLARFTESYLKGMETWASIMDELGQFKGELRGKKGGEFIALTCDLSLVKEAEESLSSAGLLKK
ncbi:MAG: ABC transporter substrate-binding protein [Elusimicrobiota bacterium]